jgi:hypothetical protein
MKVSKEIYQMSEEILDIFDADRIKENEIKNVEN